MYNTLSHAHDRVVAAVCGHVGSTSFVTFALHCTLLLRVQAARQLERQQRPGREKQQRRGDSGI